MSEPVLVPMALIKKALRLTTNDYDDEIIALAEAARGDLGIAGVVFPCGMDALAQRAVITYCKLHFMGLSGQEWERLKASYDEQKAQLSTATGYTDWGAAT